MINELKKENKTSPIWAKENLKRLYFERVEIPTKVAQGRILGKY